MRLTPLRWWVDSSLTPKPDIAAVGDPGSEEGYDNEDQDREAHDDEEPLEDIQLQHLPYCE